MSDPPPAGSLAWARKFDGYSAERSIRTVGPRMAGKTGHARTPACRTPVFFSCQSFRPTGQARGGGEPK